MTIEHYTGNELVANSHRAVNVSPQDAAVVRLTEWATSARAAHAVAQSLVQTSFVPAQFRGKPEEATAAILSGLEIGLSPMSALRAFDIIQGQAAPRAITLRAVVQAAGHEMELIESTNTRCRMRGRRRGAAEWQAVTWTIDRAKDLGLVGKDNWKKQPGAMLVARCTSELARLIASDAILGIGYSSEEIADGAAGSPGSPEPAAVEPATAAPAPTKRLSRPRAQRPPQGPEEGTPAPTVPEPEPLEPAAAPSSEQPTAAAAAREAMRKAGAALRERHAPNPEPVIVPAENASALLNTASPLARRMFAALGAAGVTERDDRLMYVRDVIKRDVASSAEMTEAEAKAVIEAAEAEVAIVPGGLGPDPWAEPLKEFQP